MPIDTSSMLLKLSPLSPIDIGGLGQMGMERQRLALAREQFEETKRQHRKQAELDELELQGRLAQQRMIAEEAKRKEEAAKAAKLSEQRQAGALKYSEALASGQPDQVEALVPYLESLGSGVDITRGTGLPTYRYHMDAEADRNKGWETATRPIDQGAYDEAPPPLAPAPTMGETGTASNLQAQADERLARLSPALKDIVTAHPVDYQATADSARQGIERLNLPVDKAMTEYRMQLQGPIELAKAELEAGKKDEQRKEITPLEREQLARQGFERGANVAGTMNAKDFIERRRTIAQARDVLTNKATTDDYLAGATISRMLGERGATTEGDVERALGDAASSFLDRIKNRLFKEAFGGLSSMQRNALLGVLKKTEAEDKKLAFDFLRNMDEFESAGSTHPDVARGVRDYRNLAIPSDWREAYDAEKAKSKPKTAERAGTTAELNDPEDFEDDLMLYASEAGLDPDAIRPLIRKESGGDAQARNKDSGATGILQFLNDDIAKSVGTSLEALEGMTAQEQLPYVIEYFKTRGIDENSEPDDYAMAVAAPTFVGKPDTDVVYPKGSKAWEQNPGWRPPDGGDITVGSIKAYYRGSKSGKGGKAKAPEPQNDEDRRALEVLGGD